MVTSIVSTGHCWAVGGRRGLVVVALFRNNTALLACVSILHVLVGASGIWGLYMQWFASVDFAHIPSKAQCALQP